jgi:alpha-galactosidase
MLDGLRFDYYQKWLRISESEKLSEGEYLNLYDVGYDRPETHVIRKGHTYYYSFFSGGRFHGIVGLRGLPKGRYRATDLVTGNDVPFVHPDSPFLSLNFDRSAIIKIVKDKE